MEKFSCYQYQLLYDEVAYGWYYEIYSDDFYSQRLVVESDEFFESEGTARYAAIGHIHLLENGG